MYLMIKSSTIIKHRTDKKRKDKVKYNTHNSKRAEIREFQSRDNVSHAPSLCTGSQNTGSSVTSFDGFGVTLKVLFFNYQYFIFYSMLNIDETPADVMEGYRAV